MQRLHTTQCPLVIAPYGLTFVCGVGLDKQRYNLRVEYGKGVVMVQETEVCSWLEIASLIVPSLLTLLGWAVGALWAIKQVSLANEKSLGMQRTLMRENRVNALAVDLADKCYFASKSAGSVINEIGVFLVNVGIQEGGETYNVPLIAHHAENVERAIDNLVSELRDVGSWNDVYGTSVPLSKHLYFEITDFVSYFDKRTIFDKESPCYLFYELLLNAKLGKIVSLEDALSKRKDISDRISEIQKSLSKISVAINGVITQQGDDFEVVK